MKEDMNRSDGEGEGMKNPSRFQEAEVVLAGEWAGEPSPELLGPRDLSNKHIIPRSLEGSSRCSEVSSSRYPYSQPFPKSTTLTNAWRVTALLVPDQQALFLISPAASTAPALSSPSNPILFLINSVFRQLVWCIIPLLFVSPPEYKPCNNRDVVHYLCLFVPIAKNSP